MAYCSGCGRYVGDYSAHHLKRPGKDELTLCYGCKRWADKHPGESAFPSFEARISPQSRRIRTFATIYMVSSLGVFALGAAVALESERMGLGLLMILGAVSLFLLGLAMQKFSRK